MVLRLSSGVEAPVAAQGERLLGGAHLERGGEGGHGRDYYKHKMLLARAFCDQPYSRRTGRERRRRAWLHGSSLSRPLQARHVLRRTANVEHIGGTDVG